MKKFHYKVLIDTINLIYQYQLILLIIYIVLFLQQRRNNMANEVKFIANSLQILNFEISSLTTQPLNQETISSVIWRMSRYGTSTTILEKTMLDAITIEGNIITVKLDGVDTINLYGLFNQQLTIIDTDGNNYVIEEKRVIILPYIQQNGGNI